MYSRKEIVGLRTVPYKYLKVSINAEHTNILYEIGPWRDPLQLRARYKCPICLPLYLQTRNCVFWWWYIISIETKLTDFTEVHFHCSSFLQKTGCEMFLDLLRGHKSIQIHYTAICGNYSKRIYKYADTVNVSILCEMCTTNSSYAGPFKRIQSYFV